jgi:hypothetical protein
MLRVTRFVLFLFAMFLSCTVGCGPSGPQVVPVSGKLTRNGQGVSNMEVYFIPTQGRNSVASTDEQGNFNLGYTADQAGAQVGNHSVFVSFNPADPTAAPPKDLNAILAKYGKETSQLKVEVKEARSDLELKID